MDPIQPHMPPPQDNLDEGQTNERTVDEILGGRFNDCNTEKPQGPTGEITNMETQYKETSADRAETDPFHDTPEEDRVG